MNRKLFPKPAPAEPLSLDVWLDRTDRAEVGREPFFRGRDDEYEIFQKAVKSLNDGHIGDGTMIFQGAPGAGKTALMGECMEAVRLHSSLDKPWVAVLIPPGSLRYPESVVAAMIEATNLENERLLENVADTHSRWLKKALNQGLQLFQEIQNRDISIQGMSVSKKQQSGGADGLFRHASSLLKNYHFAIFVDEAQNVKQHDNTKDVLDCLHRQTQGIPPVTAFFGLSDTEDILSECGLSRLPRGRVKTLGVLSHEETARAIKSVFDAYDFKGSSKNREEWVNALSELSQGWPQHINSVSFAACQIIHEHQGSLDEGLLPRALELGRKLKNEYYVGRLRRCSEDPVVYRNLAVEADKAPDGVLSRSTLRSLISPLLEHSKTLDDFLSNALHAGVLMETEGLPKHYQIPIPSLGDYLRTLPVD